MASYKQLVDGFNQFSLHFISGLKVIYQTRSSVVAMLESEEQDIKKAQGAVPTVPITEFMKKITPKANVMDGFSLVDEIFALYLTDDEIKLLEDAKDLPEEERALQTQLMMATALRREPSTDFDRVKRMLDFGDNHLFDNDREGSVKCRLKLRESYHTFSKQTRLWLVTSIFQLVNIAESYRACEGDKTMQAQFESFTAQLSGAMK